METPIDTTPKNKFLIVDETNFDKINLLVKEQLKLEDENYATKDNQKHPTDAKYNVPMLEIGIDWDSIISEITCTQVVELTSDWIKQPENIK